MKSFEIKLKNRLNNKNSSYYKRFNGILTKIVTCKNINEVKEIYKNDLVEYKELKNKNENLFYIKVNEFVKYECDLEENEYIEDLQTDLIIQVINKK